MKPLTNLSRHPLCPECGYDLAATVEADHRICPECGESFELEELHYAPRSDDWTPRRAMKRLAVVLAIKGIVVAAGIAIIMLILEAMSARLPSVGGAFATLGVLFLMLLALIALGYVVGRVISFKIVEVAGTGGIVVALLGAISSAGAVTLGVWSAHFIQPYQDINPQAVLFIVVAASILPIVRAAVLDEL